MTRERVIAHMTEKYNASAEYPWARTPQYAVFRHAHNRKWFATIINVRRDKLGLLGDEVVDAMLLKCDPLMAGSLRDGENILSGYHMNKEHWITVILDGTLSAKQIYRLIELSYNLTR